MGSNAPSREGIHSIGRNALLRTIRDTPSAWGSTVGERQARFPADRFLNNPDDTLFRAIDVAAPAPLLFR